MYKRQILFGTTSTFLERLGINDISDLPPLANFVPGADIVEALEDGLRLDQYNDVLDSQERNNEAKSTNDEAPSE